VNLFDFYGYSIFVPVLGCSCFSIFIPLPPPADLGDSLVILFQFCFAIEIWFSGRQRFSKAAFFSVGLGPPVFIFCPWVQCCSRSSQFLLRVPVPNSVSAGQIVFPVSRAGRLLKVLDFCSGCPSHGRRAPKCAQCSLWSGFLTARIVLPPLKFDSGAARFPTRDPSLTSCAFRFQSASC
jgi:hypothetical protein